MERNFSRSLAAVLKHEGGYVNHPKDPGGPTNMGVTLANFRRFVKPDGTVTELKALTIDQAGVVFRRQYWDEIMGNDLPDGVDFATFDFAVNSGPSRAAKYLQRLVGAKQDGVIGPATLKAVKARDKIRLINELCDARQAFLEGLDIFPTFGKGWTRRVKETRELALIMANQKPQEAKEVVIEQVPSKEAVPVPVPVVPEGSDKRSGLWTGALTGIGSVVASVWGAIADMPLGVKVGIGIVTLGAIGFLLFRGELVIRRVKALVAEIG